MQSQRAKLLAVVPNQFYGTSFLSALKPHFEMQLAGSLDMGAFLLKEWEPDVVLVDFNGDLEQFPQQSQVYFANPQKTLIVMSSSLPVNVDKLYRWNVSTVVDVTDSPEKAVFLIRSLHNKVCLLSTARGHGGPSEAPKPYKECLGLKIYENDYIVKRGEQVITTTPTQFKLLMAFTNHQDKLLSRQWIKESVWQNSDISPRSIDAQISKLKKLLPELDGCLMNIYGKGYILSESQKSAA